MLRDISPSLISFTKQPAGIVLTSWRVFGHIYGVLLNKNERFWNGLVWLCSVSFFLPCFLDTAERFDIWNLFRQKSKLPDCYFIHFFFFLTHFWNTRSISLLWGLLLKMISSLYYILKTAFNGIRSIVFVTNEPHNLSLRSFKFFC